MIQSIFLNHIYFILLICVLVCIFYLYHCLNEKKQVEEFFIPDFPSMSEYYVQKIKEVKKPKIKYFMAIPYGDNLVSKNNLWNMVRDCRESIPFLPNSFILENFYDYKELNKTFNKDKIYILKKNIHRKTGLKLFKGTLNALKNEYFDGGYKVIQEFVKEPFLVNNRIVVARMYLLLKRTNNGYEYAVHKYGKCLYTPKDFSIKGLQEDRMITDNKTILDDRFPKEIDNLLKYGIEREVLLKPIKKVLKCFKKYVENLDETPYHEQLTFFQLFGVDIILDKKRNPYLLELNKNPDMGNLYYQYDRYMKNKVILDVRELVKNGVYSNFTKL
jgi:hypothetical protein